MLLADAGRGDWIACQITSNPYADSSAITLLDENFIAGGLQRVSHVRPGKLFTASTSLFAVTAGSIDVDKLDDTRHAVIAIILG